MPLSDSQKKFIGCAGALCIAGVGAVGYAKVTHNARQNKIDASLLYQVSEQFARCVYTRVGDFWIRQDHDKKNVFFTYGLTGPEWASDATTTNGATSGKARLKRRLHYVTTIRVEKPHVMTQLLEGNSHPQALNKLEQCGELAAEKMRVLKEPYRGESWTQQFPIIGKIL